MIYFTPYVKVPPVPAVIRAVEPQDALIEEAVVPALNYLVASVFVA